MKKVYELKDHQGQRSGRADRVEGKQRGGDGSGAPSVGSGRSVVAELWYVTARGYGDNSINPNQLNYRYGYNGKDMDN